MEVFLEHNPIDQQNDYIYLLPSAGSTAVIYKTSKLKHRDGFKIKICKEDTISRIKQGKEEKDDCLEDVYNTEISGDFKTSIPLTKNRIYNLYQSCVFGLSLSEGEKSLLYLSAQHIKEKKNLENANLFYRNPEEILELYENPVRKEYRNDFRTNQDTRCNLKFNTELEFEEDLFLDNVMLIENKGDSSVFIIEYNFPTDHEEGTEFFKEEAPLIGERLSADQLIKKKSDIIDKVGNIITFEKKQVKKEVLKIAIASTDGTIVIKNQKNGEEGEEHTIDTQLKENEFYRFYPMFCYEHISSAETKDLSTLVQHECAEMSEKKILLANKDKQILFINEEGYSSSLEFGITTLDFVYWHKETPSEKVIIDGIEDNCDVIIDGKYSILFYLCYQKSRIMKDQKLLKELTKDLKFHTYSLERNSNGKKVDKRILGNMPLIWQLLRLGISIGCLVGMIIVFSVGASWIAGLVLGICFLVFFIWFLSVKLCRDRGRILAEFKIEKYLDEKNLEEVKRNIRNASMGSYSALKGKNKAVVDMKDLNNKVWTESVNEDFVNEKNSGKNVQIHLGNHSIINADFLSQQIEGNKTILVEGKNGIDINFEGVKKINKSSIKVLV